MAYCTSGDVANRLDLPTKTVLSADVAGTRHLSPGDTAILLADAKDVTPGASLLVGYRGTTGEVVTVASMAGLTANLAAPLAADHYAGERVIDVTPFSWFTEAAAEAIDAYTGGRRGWMLYDENVTDTLTVRSSREGDVVVPVSKRPVKEVIAFTYATAPWMPTWSDPVDQVWFDDDSYFVKAYLGKSVPVFPGGSSVRVQINYKGGYEPGVDMPAALVHANAVLAARFWKEKDSGFSDVIGSGDAMGETTYKLAIPKDIRMILDAYKRVGFGI